ncbi:uncharacterized protein LOC133295400 [Gastrolobium bilobum]|uniref:uncharacterized protein LOC133295400 n=1 Tax=Gastrolobium bilobum TaxID=150636 RepID=UPI002AB28910|nr:uncharacterized protein LOC133295400 [Gastrolobium bilobum]
MGCLCSKDRNRIDENKYRFRGYGDMVTMRDTDDYLVTTEDSINSVGDQGSTSYYYGGGGGRNKYKSSEGFQSMHTSSHVQQYHAFEGSSNRGRGGGRDKGVGMVTMLGTAAAIATIEDAIASDGDQGSTGHYSDYGDYGDYGGGSNGSDNNYGNNNGGNGDDNSGSNDDGRWSGGASCGGSD